MHLIQVVALLSKLKHAVSVRHGNFVLRLHNTGEWLEREELASFDMNWQDHATGDYCHAHERFGKPDSCE